MLHSTPPLRDPTPNIGVPATRTLRLFDNGFFSWSTDRIGAIRYERQVVVGVMRFHSHRPCAWKVLCIYMRRRLCIVAVTFHAIDSMPALAEFASLDYSLSVLLLPWADELTKRRRELSCQQKVVRLGRRNQVHACKMMTVIRHAFVCQSGVRLPVVEHGGARCHCPLPCISYPIHDETLSLHAKQHVVKKQA